MARYQFEPGRQDARNRHRLYIELGFVGAEPGRDVHLAETFARPVLTQQQLLGLSTLLPDDADIRGSLRLITVVAHDRRSQRRGCGVDTEVNVRVRSGWRPAITHAR